MKILKFAPPSGNDVTFMVNVCASRLKTPSEASVASKTCGHADPDPAMKSSHNSIVEDKGSGTHPEFTPFTLKASNSMSPLENWNLTL